MAKTATLSHTGHGLHLNGTIAFCKKNAMLLIAAALALLTMIVIPPDRAYAAYFDWKTLSCLFSTLAVVCALKSIRFFTYLARKIVTLAGNTRMAILALMGITFIGSMFMANDMALLTFLPLGYDVLSSTKQEKHIPFTFIMQNISANLGGMLTPFGNPQNLFLYEKFHIANSEFVSIMVIPFAAAVLLIFVCCMTIKKEKLVIAEQNAASLPKGRTALYLVLFACAILMVMRVLPWWIVLIGITVVLLIAAPQSLVKVDYGLLGTFFAFFIFAGNLARVEPVQELLSRLLAMNPLWVSAISCQFISNVPSAILLSQFTEAYPALLMGVNIGGTGTLIASLASLITFREYATHYPKRIGAYVRLFSIFNFGFLAVLLIVCTLCLPLFTV